MHRTGLRTSEQLTDAAVGFHRGEPWKVGSGGNRGGEQVSPQEKRYKRRGSNPFRILCIKKYPPCWEGIFLWRRVRDSNPGYHCWYT